MQLMSSGVAGKEEKMSRNVLEWRSVFLKLRAYIRRGEFCDYW